MKKTLIAMAAVAVAGVASAQVTITGKLGVGVRDSSISAKEIVTSDSGITVAATEDDAIPDMSSGSGGGAS